jgi:hypothetical protein
VVDPPGGFICWTWMVGVSVPVPEARAAGDSPNGRGRSGILRFRGRSGGLARYCRGGVEARAKARAEGNPPTQTERRQFGDLTARRQVAGDWLMT